LLQGSGKVFGCAATRTSDIGEQAMKRDCTNRQEPALVQFSRELAQAQGSLENSIADMLDVLRWRACLKHGFPKRTSSASCEDTSWTLNGTHYAATPTGAVDAVLREELAGKDSDSDSCTKTTRPSVGV
jgi:hypothetical protein